MNSAFNADAVDPPQNASNRSHPASTAHKEKSLNRYGRLHNCQHPVQHQWSSCPQRSRLYSRCQWCFQDIPTLRGRPCTDSSSLPGAAAALTPCQKPFFAGNFRTRSLPKLRLYLGSEHRCRIHPKRCYPVALQASMGPSSKLCPFNNYSRTTQNNRCTLPRSISSPVITEWRGDP